MVSVREKGPVRRDQVRIKEMSNREPSMRCRNISDDVKTGVLRQPQDKLRGSLFIVWAASGIEMA